MQIKGAFRLVPILSLHRLPNLILFVPLTPIRVPVLRSILADYPVTADAELLLNGFTYSFRVGYAGPGLPRDSLCLDSEIALGRIAGPFFERPFPNLQCSPIGLVPKREPNSFRLIHHLSFP